MKANELMIGDWVVYDGDIEYTNPVQVKEMDMAIDSLITSDREYVGFDGVQPIPLTPEILEKNGWITGQFYSKLLAGGWQVLSDCSYIAARSEDGWIVNVPCRFIHELQHALRLCGIDREIIL